MKNIMIALIFLLPTQLLASETVSEAKKVKVIELEGVDPTDNSPCEATVLVSPFGVMFQSSWTTDYTYLPLSKKTGSVLKPVFIDTQFGAIIDDGEKESWQTVRVIALHGKGHIFSMKYDKWTVVGYDLVKNKFIKKTCEIR